MPRPFPWLSRLADIRRSVSNSQRSGYTRRDLELLFGISPRAASRLMDMLASMAINNSHLVDREKLAAFLEQAAETTDVAALCERIRADRENLTRTKVRYLYLRDDAQVPLTSLPTSIMIEPGRLEIRFDTVEQLVADLRSIALAMNDDPVAFAARCDTRPVDLPENPDVRFFREDAAEFVARWRSPEGAARFDRLTPAQQKFVAESLDKADLAYTAALGRVPPNAEKPPHPQRVATA